MDILAKRESGGQWEGLEVPTLGGVVKEVLNQELAFQLTLQGTENRQWGASRADRVLSTEGSESRPGLEQVRSLEEATVFS